MKVKPWSQLFDPDTNQVLDQQGLMQEMFGSQRDGNPVPDRVGSPPPPRRPAPATFSPRSQQMFSPFENVQNIGGQHFGHLQGMVGQVNNAWQNEMDSRVAQAREQRRMQHEKELMAMRMEAQRRADEGALIRSILSDI